MKEVLRQAKEAHLLGCLDLAQVDGLAEPRLGGEHSGIAGATCGGDDLAATPVDSIGVEHDVANLNHNTTHVLLCKHTLLREHRKNQQEYSLQTNPSPA